MNKEQVRNQLKEMDYFNKYSIERQDDVVEVVLEKINEDHDNRRTATRFVVAFLLNCFINCSLLCIYLINTFYTIQINITILLIFLLIKCSM